MTQDQYHPTRFRDIAVTVDFHCNSACTFCIVQEGMNRFKGVPFERFRALVDENQRSRKYDRVIFTGGEVTLEKSLFTFVEYARAAGAFRHIRLQTNGRRLADPAFARALADAGVTEFFVSLHGDTPALHDAITRRAGSFDDLVRGLDNLRALPVAVLTNTVLHRANAAALPAIVAVAHAHGVPRMEFWNYLPMEDHADARALIAPLAELMPPLRAALDRCAALGVAAVTKYVPRCQLGPHGATLDNGQSDTIIVESFWDHFPRFDCLYEAVCEHSDECLGLHHDYVNKFGWEEATLAPAPRTRPWAEKTAPPPSRPGDPPAADPAVDPAAVPPAATAAPVSGHPAWEALLAELPAALGRVAHTQLTRNQARYQLALAGADARVELVLAARDDAAPALARTRSFNVFYTGAAGTYDRAAMEQLLRAACASVAARDAGQLSLDPRKGLVQLALPARRPRRAG